MAIRFYKPHPALQPYVQNLGYVHLVPQQSEEFIDIDFFPHGFPALILNLNPAQDIYDYALQKEFRTFFRFSGQFDSHRSYRCRTAHFVFINFTPFGAYFLLGVPQGHFLNSKVEVEDVFPKMKPFCTQLEDLGGNSRELLHLLQHWLLEQLGTVKSNNIKRVEYVVGLIKKGSGNMPIRNVCRDAGMSITSLEDHFKEKVGLSPKMFSRIERFNQCLHYINKKQDSSWSSIAQEFDYFDQMHFIREFKKFYGYTPAKIGSSEWNMSKLLTS
jgi:AraC-like DNA-binding protein